MRLAKKRKRNFTHGKNVLNVGAKKDAHDDVNI